MKLLKKVKKGNKRKIYFLGVQIFNYKHRKKEHISKQSPNAVVEVPISAPIIEKYPFCEKNAELKNIASRKRCFLLATGPSIKNQDLRKLQGEDCFSISNFFLHPDINVINPKYHFFAPYHPPLILDNYLDWMRLADEKLPATTEMILCDSNEYLVRDYNLFSKRKIWYLHFKGVEEPVNTDITQPIKAPQTGPIMILPVMSYMGYKEIYLIGQDMNRLASYGGTTPNFYSANQDIRKNATSGEQWVDIIPELERTLIMFRQFKDYADYFKENHIDFYNLSPNSWLSFIEKKNFDDVLK